MPPVLLPRANEQTVPTMPGPQIVPGPDDWATVYPELEMLYVHDRKKLRFVMQHMERKYGFKAT